jgi:16S rRNA (guanine(966)-N(2))-methyltransferase RsmD
MRITGGSLGGRQVKVPSGIIRPAMDRMRESIFAFLGDISGHSFLDLFSGSGIIALEAASRGAVEIEAVEADKQKSKTILANLAMSPVRINAHFVSAELYVLRGRRSFDYIFCDPPFPYQHKWDLIKKIAASPLMNDDTLLLLHRPRADYCKEAGVGFTIVGKKEYGNSVVEFVRKGALE